MFWGTAILFFKRVENLKAGDDLKDTPGFHPDSGSYTESGLEMADKVGWIIKS